MLYFEWTFKTEIAGKVTRRRSTICCQSAFDVMKSGKMKMVYLHYVKEDYEGN
jgi:hypothetical protein